MPCQHRLLILLHGRLRQIPRPAQRRSDRFIKQECESRVLKPANIAGLAGICLMQPSLTAFSKILSYTCLFTLPQPLQYHRCTLPGILYDLSGSHLDMAQRIIFSDLPNILQIKIFTHYRFRHHPHHLLPAARRADRSADPYSLPMS